MKNVKNIIASLVLVGLLGAVNIFAAKATTDPNSSNQQYLQGAAAQTWLDGLFDYVNNYLMSSNIGSASSSTTETLKNGKLAVNHNETLVRDEL